MSREFGSFDERRGRVELHLYLTGDAEVRPYSNSLRCFADKATRVLSVTNCGAFIVDQCSLSM